MSCSLPLKVVISRLDAFSTKLLGIALVISMKILRSEVIVVSFLPQVKVYFAKLIISWVSSF